MSCPSWQRHELDAVGCQIRVKPYPSSYRRMRLHAGGALDLGFVGRP